MVGNDLQGLYAVAQAMLAILCNDMCDHLETRRPASRKKLGWKLGISEQIMPTYATKARFRLSAMHVIP